MEEESRLWHRVKFNGLGEIPASHTNANSHRAYVETVVLSQNVTKSTALDIRSYNIDMIPLTLDYLK